MDKIFDFILIIICIIFNALIFILSKDYNIKITIITFIFTIAILVLFYLKKRNFTRYMNDILVKLSDMLSTISDMREEEVFSFVMSLHCLPSFSYIPLGVLYSVIYFDYFSKLFIRYNLSNVIYLVVF